MAFPSALRAQVAGGQSTPGAPIDVGAALGKLSRGRSGLKTLTAVFVQERRIGLLATVVRSRGSLTLVRPDRLRWELEPPDAVVYWVGPEGFSYALASGGATVSKAAAGRFGAVLGDLLVLLGGDLEALRTRYELAASERDEGLTLQARPLQPDLAGAVKRIELAVAPDCWSLRSVTLVEKGDDRSTIRFEKVVRDAPVDPARMKPGK